MTLGLIILILLVGLFCLFSEFFLFPGLTATGIMALICLITGVYFGYREYGYDVGNIIFVSTLISSGLIFWLGVRSLSSKKFAVHESIDSKVNLVDEVVVPGLKGKAVSALRPGGTALLDNARMEVFTRGEFIEPGTELEVLRVDGSRIIVQAVPES